MIGKVNVYLKSELKQTTLEYIQKALLEQFKKKKSEKFYVLFIIIYMFALYYNCILCDITVNVVKKL